MHPPEPVSYSPEPIPIGVPDDRPPVMPRRLRVLRILFGLASLLALFGLATLVLALIGAYLAPPPGMDRGEDLLLLDHVLIPTVGIITGVSYGIAAARLGRGDAIALQWALIAIGTDVGLQLALIPTISNTEGLVVAVAVSVLGLVFPGLFLLLLLTRASRDWFRTAA
ncbi:hypothetical protein [Nocardiopsis sp. NRRL B-16309]|uniref:hypothetical protein n=1 Tax=Nocardiopsis sp. NRRL B-16309 TaxID=1519494 RepID=UPI0006AEFFFE|nr:hypothetical protein [Nocardiopsis sp. NRRL B-16309]KOX22188.1 hypothetical protein ADL05_04160 [Nocardiopsis sp. NRRL B-16309]